MTLIKENKYYDSQQNRLVYCSKEASSKYWDELWGKRDFNHVIKGKKNRVIIKTTRKYLHPGSRIIEGGCGMGDKVYSLQRAGFDVYGVDFAADTVGAIKKYAPELKIYENDVRKLQFGDNFFDGYWSLGVIEHFFEGYDDIAKEMSRVLKPGGFLFITFPYMSPLRSWKARRSCYPLLPEGFSPAKNNFYQFALNFSHVVERLNLFGFNIIESFGLDCVKGLKSEIHFFRPVLQRLYKSSNFSAKVAMVSINYLLSNLCSHAILIVFRNNKN